MKGKDKEEQILINKKKQYQIYCKCGHHTYIYPMEKRNKKICTWCGNYIYIDKKTEFKERLGNLL